MVFIRWSLIYVQEGFNNALTLGVLTLLRAILKSGVPDADVG